MCGWSRRGRAPGLAEESVDHLGVGELLGPEDLQGHVAAGLGVPGAVDDPEGARGRRPRAARTCRFATGRTAARRRAAPARRRPAPRVARSRRACRGNRARYSSSATPGRGHRRSSSSARSGPRRPPRRPPAREIAEVFLDTCRLARPKPELELGVDQLDQDRGPALRVGGQGSPRSPAAPRPARPPRTVP